MRRRFLLAIVLALLLCPPVFADDLGFSPPQWDFGMIRQGEKVRLTVTVTNHRSEPVAVTFVPTCSCMTVEPRSRAIAGGTDGSFDLSYDSSDDTGITKRGFIVSTDVPGARPSYYLLTGVVRQERTATSSGDAGPASSGAGAAASEIPLAYYYTPGCRGCEQFLSVEIPRQEKALDIVIDVRRRDVLDTAVYQELQSAAASRGQAVTAIPAILVGDTLLQGDDAIREGLTAALVLQKARPGQASSPSSASAGAPAAPVSTTERLAVLPVVVAGLIDGINPCAFTTLIFLLASLALAGRGRREVLLIGALFSFAVFLTYFLVGLGFFAALRAVSSFSTVSIILRWVLVVVLVAFAGLSVYDYFLIRAGRPTEILLQLPTSLKKRIHSSIRSRVRTAAIAGSSLVLGFLVSLFEFACTGQVYLPTLGYIARVQRQGYAIGLLGLYNLCFILPLLAVFTASYAGVSSARITAAFQAHMGKVKLGLAVVFLGLAAITLVG